MCSLKNLLRKIVGLCQPAAETSPTIPDTPPAVAVQERPDPPKLARVETRAKLPEAWMPQPERVHAPRQASSVYSQDDCTESQRMRMGRWPSSDDSWRIPMPRVFPLPQSPPVGRHVTWGETAIYSPPVTPPPSQQSVEAARKRIRELREGKL